MSPLLRTEITHHVSDDIGADFATHTVYHTVADGLFDPSVGYQNHADQLRDLFAGQDATHAAFQVYARRTLQAVVYDMADPLPRPERAASIYHPASQAASGDLGPRQVALVLSFYGTRNLPRQRGHIYIGPFDTGSINSPVPTVALLDNLLDLGHGLFDVGGENVAHVARSTIAGGTTVIQNYWVDNRWDTQRRRLPKASLRHTLAP